MAIITISRGSLSGGAKLAEALGERLGLRVIGREVIVESAKTYGVSEAQIAQRLREPPGLWSRLTRHAGDYVLAVQATLSALVAQDEVVYHGLAGAFLLGEVAGVLKLRLIAPLAEREQAAMRQLGLDRARARAHVQEVDEQRARWVRALYGKDWADPSHYDLVLNLGELSIDSAADIVAAMAETPEYKLDDEKLARIRDFALRSAIVAHLRLRSTFADVHVEVHVERGEVTLRGGNDFVQARDEILRFVRAIPGAEGAHAAGEQEVASVASDRAVRQLMVPLHRYPHVTSRATIGEAVRVLRQATVSAASGCLAPPRFVLVVDEPARLVGILSRRDMLRGLSPTLRSVERALGTVAATLPFRTSGVDLAVGWDALFTPSSLDGASEPVTGVMRELYGTVQPHDPLGAAVRHMLQHEIDLVPVVDGHEVVGVVRMTDLFTAVASHAEQASAPTSGTCSPALKE